MRWVSRLLVVCVLAFGATSCSSSGGARYASTTDGGGTHEGVFVKQCEIHPIMLRCSGGRTECLGRGPDGCYQIIGILDRLGIATRSHGSGDGAGTVAEVCVIREEGCDIGLGVAGGAGRGRVVAAASQDGVVTDVRVRDGVTVDMHVCAGGEVWCVVVNHSWYHWASPTSDGVRPFLLMHVAPNGCFVVGAREIAASLELSWATLTGCRMETGQCLHAHDVDSVVERIVGEWGGIGDRDEWREIGVGLIIVLTCLGLYEQAYAVDLELRTKSVTEYTAWASEVREASRGSAVHRECVGMGVADP